MAFPAPIKAIDDKIVQAEQWLNTPRFLMLFALFLAIGVALGASILHRRSDGGWMTAPCGQEQWSKSSFPVPVWLAPEDLDWEQPLRDAMPMMDETGRLFAWAGVLPLGRDPTVDPWVRVQTINSDRHGDSVVTYDHDCRIQHVEVRVPGLVLPGKNRTRATAHELGHALGLAHSDWETSIMYKDATTLFPFKLSDADRGRIQSAYLAP